jgi:alcohol dehydrogenase (cytochrome c)
MKRKGEIIIIVLLALVAAGVGTGAALHFAYPVQIGAVAGAVRSTIISYDEPPSAVTTEVNPNYKAPPASPQRPAGAVASDRPSYNKTLTTERFSEVSAINTKNVGKLKVLCIYDTKQYAAFEAGLLMVEGALIGTTEFDIFSVDPATCKQNWRTHEEYPPALLPANRGAAQADLRS